eukprot:5087258-Pleurochrysis_carterae.AAC.2
MEGKGGAYPAHSGCWKAGVGCASHRKPFVHSVLLGTNYHLRSSISNDQYWPLSRTAASRSTLAASKGIDFPCT